MIPTKARVHLLDVNGVIALLDESHVHHLAMTEWFSVSGLEWRSARTRPVGSKTSGDLCNGSTGSQQNPGPPRTCYPPPPSKETARSASSPRRCAMTRERHAPNLLTTVCEKATFPCCRIAMLFSNHSIGFASLHRIPARPAPPQARCTWGDICACPPQAFRTVFRRLCAQVTPQVAARR